MGSTLNVPFRPDSIPTGLVGYWKFNNDATDSSGKGYDLTAAAGAAAPTFIATDYWKSGEYCTDFKAADSEHYTRARNTDLDLLDAFTISFWIQADDITTVSIIDKDLNSNGYGILINGTSKYEFYIKNVALASTTSAVIGKWQHICCVYDQTTKRIYMDGNLDASAAASTDCSDTSVNLAIGILENLSGSPFDGRIKDLAIWSSALTPLQVKSLALGVDLSKYAYRPNHVSTQPTHWWKLNEVSGNRADSIGSATLTDGNTVLSSGGYVEGTAADFELSASEYLYHAYDASFDMSNSAFTLRARIKFESVADVYQDIMGTMNGVSNNGWRWRIDPNATTKDCSFWDSTQYVTFALGSALPVGVFFDLVLVKSGTTLKFYLDGVQVGGNQTVAATITDLNNEFQLGRGNGSNNYFDGVIEDVAIWKGYALSDAEIASLACALPIQRQGIVSYWKMENVNDSIGTNNLTDGGIVGYTTAGKVGNSADFESGDSKDLSLANNDSIDITSDMAILGWLKPESVGANRMVLDKDYAGDGYGIRILAANTVNFYITNDTDVTTTTVAAGTWIHFAGYYDGAVKGIYANGVLQGNGAYTTNPADATTDLHIGSTVAGGDYYDGLIDELVLTKRYFRPEEIKAVYLKGLNGKEVTSTERRPGASQVMFLT